MEYLSDCTICHECAAVVYGRLSDTRFNTGGSFDLRFCRDCGLGWTDPRPDSQEIKKYYEHFYAQASPHVFLDHFLARDQKRPLAGLRNFFREIIICGYFGYRQIHADHRFCEAGKVLGAIPAFRFRASLGLGVLFPEAPKGSDALFADVGCGEGGQLELMRYLGWKVLGVEPLPEAVAICAQKGLPVLQGSLEDVDLLEKSIDVIMMNHVLEHTRDPRAVVEKCWRSLKKGGRLVLRVPNIESLGHRFFKRHLYSLDVPRHFYHFSQKSLKLFFKDIPFEFLRLQTTSRAAKTIYDNSVAIAREGATNPAGARPRRGRHFFALLESLLCLCGCGAGEEIELTAVK